jgi:hypothetical protein
MSWDEADIEADDDETAEVAKVGTPIDDKPIYEVPPEDQAKVKGLKMAIYGIEKVGKTIAAASACLQKEATLTVDGSTIPPCIPVKYIDTEEAAYWLRKFYPEEFEKGNIEIITVYVEKQKTKEIDPVASFDLFWETLSKLSTMTEGTIVIDSLSDVLGWINSYLRIKILGIQKEQTGAFQADIKPHDWFWRNDRWETLMKLIRRMRCNVIVTAKAKEAWSREPNPKAGGKLQLHPTGRYDPVWHYTTGYWMDMIINMVIRFHKKKPTRCAIVRGSRAGIPIDEVIINPNVPKIVKMIAELEPELDWGEE